MDPVHEPGDCRHAVVRRPGQPPAERAAAGRPAPAEGRPADRVSPRDVRRRDDSARRNMAARPPILPAPRRRLHHRQRRRIGGVARPAVLECPAVLRAAARAGARPSISGDGPLAVVRSRGQPARAPGHRQPAVLRSGRHVCGVRVLRQHGRVTLAADVGPDPIAAPELAGSGRDLGERRLLRRGLCVPGHRHERTGHLHHRTQPRRQHDAGGFPDLRRRDRPAAVARRALERLAISGHDALRRDSSAASGAGGPGHRRPAPAAFRRDGDRHAALHARHADLDRGVRRVARHEVLPAHRAGLPFRESAADLRRGHRLRAAVRRRGRRARPRSRRQSC